MAHIKNPFNFLSKTRRFPGDKLFVDKRSVLFHNKVNFSEETGASRNVGGIGERRRKGAEVI